MKTSASLWSADQLHLAAALDRLEHVVAGFHIDVMDGQFVPELLYGPTTVAAVRAHTTALADVHLMVSDADRWIEPFAASGAGMLTVHAPTCRDVAATLARIAALGVRPSLAVALDEPLEMVWPLLDAVDRVLLMGTALGIKGVGIDPTIYDRIRTTVARRDGSARRPEVFVDGGIRRETAPLIAAEGADGVTPGSLVFGAADPVEAVRWITALS